MSTDEEVVTKQEEVTKLRAELEQLRLGKGAQYLQEQSNDITMAQLSADEARLNAQIAQAKAQNSKSAVVAGASVPLAAAKEEMAAAVALQKATAKSVVEPSSTERKEEVN